MMYVDPSKVPLMPFNVLFMLIVDMLVLSKSQVWNYCEGMHKIEMKTNLFASLADQLLPEGEGFQMLQSISVEKKYLWCQTYS